MSQENRKETDIPSLIPILPETPETELSWTFNGFSVEFDMTDVDMRKHYMDCVNRMNERQKTVPKDEETDDIVRRMCTMLRDFLDDLFGEGVGRQMIDRDSQAKVQNCFASLNNFVRQQLSSTLNASAEMAQRWANAPQNREQRRAAAKGAKKP